MTLTRLARKDVSSAVKTGLVYFSAVYLGTVEFLRHAFPSPDILNLPLSVVLGALLILLALPFSLILALDWQIRRRFSPVVTLRFRACVMATGLVLQLRQAQLFLRGGQTLTADLVAISPVVFVVVMVALSLALVLITFRLQESFRTFFYYFSPVALFLTLTVPLSVQTQNARFDDYSAREVEAPSPSRDPVYIVVFDELSYSALLGEDGEIDAQHYPNFARLGDESLQLTNATGNYFYTWVQVPEMIDATLALSGEYEVRLYEQTHRIAAYYADGCGHAYTCRDVNYVGQRSTTQLTLSVVARAFYFAAPAMLESAGRGLFHPILRSIGTISPSSDLAGIHLLTRSLVDQYLDDIEAENPGGRVFFLHTLLPHNPYVFDAEGEFHSDERSDYVRTRSPTEKEFIETWPHYKEQIRYADTILGEIIDALQRRGLYDKATLIVTSDHGLRLSYPTEDHAIEMPTLTPEVPMFIRSPRVEARKSNIDYQHVDFGPTLLDLLGIQSPGLLAPRDDLPGPSARVSALSENRPIRDKVFFAPAVGVYWTYVYDEALQVWQNVDKVDHAIGDRTSLDEGK
jgi:hypothetical protein